MQKQIRLNSFKYWGVDATNFKQQPGFISTQLHKGIEKSTVFLNYAVWD